MRDRRTTPLTRRRCGRACGFTLVEALAAGVILAVSTSAIGTGISQSLRSRSLCRDTQRAAELLDLVMTRIDMIGPRRLQYEGPTSGQLDERFSWEAEIDARLDGDLYEVTATITWLVPGGRRKVEAHTLLNDPIRSRNPIIEWDDL